ncbi:protein of unknown function [Chitinophaga costaii]|uniref:3-keto-alpha-glucoside-1,2-lyase/3-keto-2-hydroxy-glucal hydratase domain-containing protein n=1 Tax=Chitinophaga costaii TaxID=1335309 RepID=A0A1C4BF64_9BACT|nr:DUF1080 domain-containing protein [Chitinophaga costaii]PUZ27631.1 DUF1080 domain-containing protein [Chitinophaga costaii]SCC05601.1 protein of unknown function [Chitinophaga costaii]
MIKNFILLLAMGALLGTASAQHNTLTSKEKKQGWTLLFDGKTTTGWHAYLSKDAGTHWQVVDGALQLTPDAEHAGRPSGNDLVTNDEYENFELEYQWKISEGGNSGLIFSVHEDPQYKEPYLTGLEMQVLDDSKHPDGKIAKHNSGDLYDLAQAPKLATKPVGEWNTAKLSKKNGHLQLWLNGVKTADVTIGSPEWNTMLANSKFKTWKGFAAYPKGSIALQDHGHEVWYRDIKIRQL